jgi:hypothetical protein
LPPAISSRHRFDGAGHKDVALAGKVVANDVPGPGITIITGERSGTAVFVHHAHLPQATLFVCARQHSNGFSGRLARRHAL